MRRFSEEPGPTVVLCLFNNAIKKEPMEGNVSKLSTREIEEQIKDLEHTYAEFFGDGGDAGELHRIRKKILELQKELKRRIH
ncbi:MAG: hypothetical protein J7502_11180 [Flavisolibacter sp.]|nr:hypothetical protein [Flavisolibacter sp.]